MPLIFEKRISATKKTGVWEITENPDFFQSEEQFTTFHSHHPKRRLERLVCSYLLGYLTKASPRPGLLFDEYGKPYLEDQTHTVSFSHSGNFISCIIGAPDEDVGIDIEYLRPNIAELSRKFANRDDSAPLNGDEGLQLIWGAKEALYKIHGKKSLDFKTNLQVRTSPFFSGIIRLEGTEKSYPLDYTRIGEYFMVWNV